MAKWPLHRHWLPQELRGMPSWLPLPHAWLQPYHPASCCPCQADPARMDHKGLLWACFCQP